MITKPEDACFVAAVTKADLLKQSFGGSAEMQLFIAQANAQPMVTAKQCAEIAREYAQAQVDVRVGSMVKKASSRLRAADWDAKFKEWEA